MPWLLLAAGNVRFRMMYLSDDDWNRIDIRTYVSVGSYSVIDKFKTKFQISELENFKDLNLITDFLKPCLNVTNN